MGCFLEGRAGFCGEIEEDWVASPPWQSVLATWESHLLPEGKKLLSLEFLLYWCKSFSRTIHQLSHIPSLAGALGHAWQGNTTALPTQVRHSSLWSPLVSLAENAECTQFPLLMFKLCARPEVKNKNQKQSSWTALIWNHPLPPSPSLQLMLHPALLYSCSYVWQWQFWCGEGT